MEFDKVSQVEEVLRSITCKSYTIDIKFDDNNRIFIEKTPEEKKKEIGFRSE
jgi:hypothetical protein